MTAVNIVIFGDGKYDSDYQSIIKNSKIFVGKRLNHSDYEQLKNKLYNLALFKGYFDAHFRKSQLIVIPSCYQSIWNINFYSGQRYFVKEIKFKGNQIKEEYLKNISNIRIGEYYDSKSIIELNRRLFSTDWFDSIFISPESSTCLQQKKIILNVLLSPKIKNSFEIGSGYTADSGARAKVIWKKPWINAYGHSLENSCSLSIIEQRMDLNYKIPVLKYPLDQYYLFQGGVIREDLYDNIQSSVITVNIARYWHNSNNWKRSVNLHWYLDYGTQKNNITKTMMFIYPGISMSRIRQCGDSISSWGDSQRYSVNISTHYWGSDADFIIVQAENIWIRTFLQKHRILIRGNLSWIGTKQISSIIPALHFFSIKDRGIRGYEYKSISSHDDTQCIMDAPTKLITNTFEYQYNVTGKWWSAIFVDSGEITNDIRWDNFKSGIGAGIRMQLPVGFLKADIATSWIHKNRKNHKLLYFYISLGPEL